MKDATWCMIVVIVSILSRERRPDLVIIFCGWVCLEEESWVRCHGVGAIALLCVFSYLNSCHLGRLDVLALVCVGRRVGVHRGAWVRRCVCVVRMGRSGIDQLGDRPCVCDENCIHV